MCLLFGFGDALPMKRLVKVTRLQFECVVDLI